MNFKRYINKFTYTYKCTGIMDESSKHTHTRAELKEKENKNR